MAGIRVSKDYFKNYKKGLARERKREREMAKKIPKLNTCKYCGCSPVFFENALGWGVWHHCSLYHNRKETKKALIKKWNTHNP